MAQNYGAQGNLYSSMPFKEWPQILINTPNKLNSGISEGLSVFILEQVNNPWGETECLLRLSIWNYLSSAYAYVSSAYAFWVRSAYVGQVLSLY